MSAPVSPMRLLQSSDPVFVRSPSSSGGVDVRRVVRCACGRDNDWLIIAGSARVVFVCRCGNRTERPDVSLTDLIGLVREEPMQPAWSGIDDAVRALGYERRGPHLRLTRPHHWPRPRLSLPGVGRG